jgi:hypothetical protein
MRIFSSIVASLFLSSAALAGTAINLQPMKGYKNIDVVETKNFTGSCGKSQVHVLGVTAVRDNTFSTDGEAGKIIVGLPYTDGREPLILDDDSGLSDSNGVACVSTKSGSRLLIWSICDGSACGDDFSFFVIDPDRLVFLAPKDPKKGECNEKCASLLLGNGLPKKINDTLK